MFYSYHYLHHPEQSTCSFSCSTMYEWKTKVSLYL